jgi:hypothetical protein
MTAWQDLVKVSLLGAERAELSPAAVDFLTSLGISLPAESPEDLLEAAAVLTQFRKAGKPLTPFGEKLPDPAPPEAAPLCGERSTVHLQLILEGRYAPAMPEFLELLKKNGQILPPVCLPEIFEKSLSDEEFWLEIQPLIGARGQWLLRQNPDWQSLTAPFGESHTPFKFKSAAKKSKRQPPLENLPEALTADQFHGIVLGELTAQNFLVGEQTLLLNLLKNGSFQWRDELATAVVGAFRDWLSRAASYTWELWHYRDLLEAAAYRISPDLAESFKTGWPTEAAVWQIWSPEIARFLNILQFRKEMRENFSN